MPSSDLAVLPADFPRNDANSARAEILERVEAAIFVVQDDRFCFVNRKTTELLGYTRHEMLSGMDPTQLMVPEDRPRVAEQRQRRAEGLPGHAYDINCCRRDKSRFSARIHGTLIEWNGRPANLVVLHDVSELKHATLAAERRSELLAQTEELALIGSSEYDVASGTVSQSVGMFRIFGEPPGDEVDGEWLMRRVPQAEVAIVRAILGAVRPGEPCEFEHRILRADGCVRTVLHRAMASTDGQGRVARVVGIVQDITAQRQAERKLDQLANHDEITGLPNRTGLLDALDLAVRQGRREDRRFALLVLEIDQLKLVSDSFGYAGGDRLLDSVGKRLRSCLPTTDLLAHLGSGEYVALIGPRDGLDEARALAVAELLTRSLEIPLPIDGTEVQVTCSVGFTKFPRDGDDPGRLLHQAQAAKHLAHQQGDNRLCIYTPESHAKAASRLAMEAALRSALKHDQFRLRYQPQLDLSSGAVIGVEALLRWNDPLRGPVSPLEFIPLAEETGVILPLGEWVLRTACAQNVAWQRAGLPPIRVAVNLSVRQLQQPDIARRVHAILLETGLNPRHLGLEITESVLMGEGAHVARVLGELKALGIEISLDDFGTGYSNLSYLRTLPIDVVKVDRSMVHDVTAAPQDVSMTRAVITMAHSLQMKVLAEGVETEGQLALLIAHQCDQMQGFFFSPPIAPDAVAEMLRSGRQLPERLLQRRERQRTLLLVDDESNVVSSLKRLLRRDGYRIVTADSGAQGLQRLAEESVDVIVSDQRMPGMTGVEFLRRAKELFPDTVRIVLSGYTELQSITDAVNEGAIYKFLTKPWDDARLRGHIEEAFRQKELADENRRLGLAVQAANQELAEVNRRLQTLLETQRERFDREETSLVVTRQLLENIPTPLIGFDDAGMVVFVNEDAQLLLDDAAGWLGRHADDALPPALQPIWAAADGQARAVEIASRPHAAVCRGLGGRSRARGKLMIITPAAQAAALPAA